MSYLKNLLLVLFALFPMQACSDAGFAFAFATPENSNAEETTIWLEVSGDTVRAYPARPLWETKIPSNIDKNCIIGLGRILHEGDIIRCDSPDIIKGVASFDFSSFSVLREISRTYRYVTVTSRGISVGPKFSTLPRPEEDLSVTGNMVYLVVLEFMLIATLGAFISPQHRSVVWITYAAFSFVLLIAAAATFAKLGNYIIFLALCNATSLLLCRIGIIMRRVRKPETEEPIEA